MRTRRRLLAFSLATAACGSSPSAVLPITAEPDASLAEAMDDAGTLIDIDAGAHDAATSHDDAAGDAQADAPPPCDSPFVYLRDGALWLGDAPYFLVSANYHFDVRYDPSSQAHFLGPHAKFCDDSCCSDAATCRTAVQAQLAQMKAFGINSVRMVGLAARPFNAGFHVECLAEHPGDPTVVDYCPEDANFHLDASPSETQEMIGILDDAIGLIKDAGMRAVLLAGHGNLDGAPAASQYATYLTTLATHFRDEPTLFAYDLANEPMFEFDTHSPDKGAASRLVGPWYDAVKAGSPRALVTMGIGDVSSTLENWDPGTLPLDFSSHHLYVPAPFDDTARNALAVSYDWLSRLPSATLIGETGASVEGAIDEAAQHDFAEFSLDEAWGCRTSGLQWWIYRDLHWGPPGEHYGLVRWDGTPRPSASAFSAWATRLPRRPCETPIYQGNNIAGGVTTRGRVIDSSFVPIPDALVRCHKAITGGYDWTLSQPDGTFELRAGSTCIEVRATAAGYAVLSDPLTGLDVNLGDLVLTPQTGLHPFTRGPSSCPAP